MAFISYSKNTVIDYVLAFGGNRDTVDPCIVGIKQLSFGETRELTRLIAERQEGAESTSEVMKISQAAQKEQFAAHVTYIKNWQLDGVEVTDPARFYMEAPPNAVSEVVMAMRDSAALTEGQAKNFERATGGTSQPKSPAAPSPAISVADGNEKNATAATVSDSPDGPAR